ncbi:MAG: ABC transporter permease [Candidatus Shapirobacteria bacterium]|jgi:putative ABC transport system permease protein
MFKPSLEDLFKSSVRSILKNKGRTILTSLGIIIGVTSVILLTSIGNGLKKYISDQFESLGANSVFVAPGKLFNDKGGFNNSGGGGQFVSTTFNLSDVALLKRSLRPNTVIPVSITTTEVRSPKITKSDIFVIGSTEQYATGVNETPSEGNGRWFTKEEYDKKDSVVVLGHTIANDLFPQSQALGKKVIIKSKNFKVIGVLDKKGSSFGGPDVDSQAFTPLDNVFDITGNNHLQRILIKTQDKNDVPYVKKEVEKILLKKYEKDAFTVFDSSQLLDSINSIIGALTTGLAGIAAISLVVGGIGIMNIMLVTVSERTREIGLRKAIGAYPRAILVQFLIEAVILSCAGGFIGILLGFLGSLAINKFFPASVTLSSILIAFGVSATVGIIFGVAPARKASKLSPIEALRYE